jgi:hypothetical protein
MSNPQVDERAPSTRMVDVLDYVRRDEIAWHAWLAASYWHSIELAADRGDTLTVVTHCRQVAVVTRAAFAIVRRSGRRRLRRDRRRR